MSDLQVTSAVVAVVDDDPRIRALLEDELIDEGVTPVLCASGYEMLESIKKHDIQLILLDLMMPGMYFHKPQPRGLRLDPAGLADRGGHSSGCRGPAALGRVPLVKRNVVLRSCVWVDLADLERQ